MDATASFLRSRGRLRARKTGGAVTWEVAGIAGTSTPSAATSCEQLKLILMLLCNGQRPGTFVPSLGFRHPGECQDPFRFCVIKNGSRVIAHPCAARDDGDPNRIPCHRPSMACTG